MVGWDRLLDEGVIRHAGGVAVRRLIEVVTARLLGHPAQAIVTGFGEQLRSGRELLDDVGSCVEPGVVSQRVANVAGARIDPIPDRLVDAPPIVELRFTPSDQVAVGGGVVTLDFYDSSNTLRYTRSVTNVTNGVQTTIPLAGDIVRLIVTSTGADTQHIRLPFELSI